MKNIKLSIKWHFSIFTLLYVLGSTKGLGQNLPFDQIGGYAQFEIQVADRDSIKAAGWLSEKQAGGFETKECRFSVSRDFGDTWASPLIVKENGFSYNGNPSVSIGPSGEIFVVCVAINTDSLAHGALIFSRSTDLGASWDAPKIIFEKRQGFPDLPKILATDSGALIVVFSDFQNKDGKLISEIEKITSLDGGTTWTQINRISPPVDPDSTDFISGYQGVDIGEGDDKQIVVSFGTYYGSGIMVAKSFDSGNSFTSPVQISNAAYMVPVTRISSYGQNIAVVVSEGHDSGEVTLVSSKDFGKNWATKELSNEGTLGTPYFDASGNFYLLWTAIRNLIVNTYYARTDDAFNLTLQKSLTGDYAINQEIKYLGVYQGISYCGDGVGFTFMKWNSSALSRIEQRCLK
jgi:hypothetical protein